MFLLRYEATIFKRLVYVVGFKELSISKNDDDDEGLKSVNLINNP